MDHYSSLCKLDIFGDEIPMTFKNDVRYKTPVGGALTIIFILSSLALTITVLVWYFVQSPYSVIAYEEFNFYVSIDISDAPLLFSVYDDQGVPIELDERLFYFKATNIIREVYEENENKVLKKYEKDLEIINCAEMKKRNETFLSQFDDHNLTNYMCIVPGQNLFLNGTRGEIRYNYSGLRLYVKRCDPELRSDCYEKQLALEKSKDKSVYFTFVSPQFDFKQTDMNAVDEVNTVINTIPIIDTLYYYYRVAKTVISYDNGGLLLFNTYKNKTTFKIADYTSEQESRADEKMYGFLEFSSTGRINNVLRNRESIFNYIGIISGLINAIFIFLRCVVFLYYDKFMFLEVLSAFVQNGLKSGSLLLSNESEHINNSKVFFLKNSNNEILNSPIRDSTKNKKNISNNITKSNSLYKIYQNLKDSERNRQQKLVSLNDNIIENKKIIVNTLNQQIKRTRQRFLLFLLCPLYCQQKLEYFALESSVIRAYSRIVNVLNFWETHIFIDSYFESNNNGEFIDNYSKNIIKRRNLV